jgi:hypothetical protein
MAFSAGLRFLFTMIIFAMITEFIAFVFVDAMGAQFHTFLEPAAYATFNAMGVGGQQTVLYQIAILMHLLTTIFLISGFVGMFIQAAKPESKTIQMYRR